MISGASYKGGLDIRDGIIPLVRVSTAALYNYMVVQATQSLWAVVHEGETAWLLQTQDPTLLQTADDDACLSGNRLDVRVHLPACG